MKSEQELIDRIEELRSHGDYQNGPKGRDLRYKHQGMIDALRWALGPSDE